MPVEYAIGSREEKPSQLRVAVAIAVVVEAALGVMLTPRVEHGVFVVGRGSDRQPRAVIDRHVAVGSVLVPLHGITVVIHQRCYVKV